MKKIGLVIALKRETSGYFEILSPKQISDRPYPVFYSNINETQIYLAISGLGKAYASACTQFLIDKYNVDLIVNTGSCGGVCPKINLGEIILPYAIMEYDYRSIKLGTPIFHLKEEFIDMAINAGIKIAFLGSADSNADTKEKKEYLHKIGIEIADWESASVIKTSKKNERDVLILKVVTDTSTTYFVEEFVQNVKKFNTSLAQKTISLVSRF